MCLLYYIILYYVIIGLSADMFACDVRTSLNSVLYAARQTNILCVNN